MSVFVLNSYSLLRRLYIHFVCFGTDTERLGSRTVLLGSRSWYLLSATHSSSNILVISI